MGSGDSALQYQITTKETLDENDTFTYNYSESKDELDPTWSDGSPNAWKDFASQDLQLLDEPDNSLFGDYVFYSVGNFVRFEEHIVET